MVEFDINYEELKEMSLEEAQKIVKEFDECVLEDAGAIVDGKKYKTELLEDENWDDWDDQGKYQYKYQTGILCECDDNWNTVKKFDIALTLCIIRSGSYFSDYYYEYEKPEVHKIVKKVIPEQIIPERTVVTIDEGNE